MPRTKYMTTITSVDPRFSNLQIIKDIETTFSKFGTAIDFDQNSKKNGIVVPTENGYVVESDDDLISDIGFEQNNNTTDETDDNITDETDENVTDETDDNTTDETDDNTTDETDENVTDETDDNTTGETDDIDNVGAQTKNVFLCDTSVVINDLNTFSSVPVSSAYDKNSMKALLTAVDVKVKKYDPSDELYNTKQYYGDFVCVYKNKLYIGDKTFGINSSLEVPIGSLMTFPPTVSADWKKRHAFKALTGKPTNAVCYGYFENEQILINKDEDETVTFNATLASQTYEIKLDSVPDIKQTGVIPKYKDLSENESQFIPPIETNVYEPVSAAGVKVSDDDTTTWITYSSKICREQYKFTEFLRGCGISEKDFSIMGGESYNWRTFVRYTPRIVGFFSEKKLSDMGKNELKNFLTNLTSENLFIYSLNTQYENLTDTNNAWLQGTMFVYKIEYVGNNKMRCTVNGPQPSYYYKATTAPNGTVIGSPSTTLSYSVVYNGPVTIEEIENSESFKYSDSWGNGIMYVLLKNEKNINIPYFLTKIKKVIKRVKQDNGEEITKECAEILEQHKMYKITSKESEQPGMNTNVVYCTCERNVLATISKYEVDNQPVCDKYDYVLDKNVIFMNYVANVPIYKEMKRLHGASNLKKLKYTYFFLTPVGGTFDLHEYLNLVQPRNLGDQKTLNLNIVNRAVDVTKFITTYVKHGSLSVRKNDEGEKYLHGDAPTRIVSPLAINEMYTMRNNTRIYNFYDYAYGDYVNIVRPYTSEIKKIKAFLLNLDTSYTQASFAKWINQNTFTSNTCMTTIVQGSKLYCSSNTEIDNENHDRFGFIESGRYGIDYYLHSMYDTSVENRYPSFLLGDFVVSHNGIVETKFNEAYRSNKKIHYKKNGKKCSTPEISIRRYVADTSPDIIFCVGDGNENGLFGNNNGCISKRSHNRRLISNRDVDMLRGFLPAVKLIHEGNVYCETKTVNGVVHPSYSQYISNNTITNYTIKDYLDFRDLRCFTEYIGLNLAKFDELTYNQFYSKYRENMDNSQYNDYVQSAKFYIKNYLDSNVYNSKPDTNNKLKNKIYKRPPLLIMLWHNSLQFALKNMLMGVVCGDVCFTSSQVLCKYGYVFSESDMNIINQALCDCVVDLLRTKKRNETNEKPYMFEKERFGSYMVKISDVTHNVNGMIPQIYTKKELSKQMKKVIKDNLKQCYLVMGYQRLYFDKNYPANDGVYKYFYGEGQQMKNGKRHIDYQYLGTFTGIDNNNYVNDADGLAFKIKVNKIHSGTTVDPETGSTYVDPVNPQDIYVSCNDPKYVSIKYNNYYRNNNGKLKTNKKNHVRFTPTTNDAIVRVLFKHDYIDNDDKEKYIFTYGDNIEKDPFINDNPTNWTSHLTQDQITHIDPTEFEQTTPQIQDDEPGGGSNPWINPDVGGGFIP